MKNFFNSKLKIRTFNQGMTYIELIVVLSIFALMSSVVIYNYRDFQAKVDVKNLASDIALKIVEAQKSSVSGLLPASGYDPDTWKPSYGVFFNLSSNSFPINNNNAFIYFADLNGNRFFDGTDCTDECLDYITVSKSTDRIDKIESYSGTTPTQISEPISITFKRPDSSAVFADSNGLLTGFDYIQITIASEPSGNAKIKIYPSGRIQVD